MTIQSISDLMEAITALYPKTFESRETAVAWTQQYRDALGSLEPDELNVAWIEANRGHHAKQAPRPADILRAHENLKKRGAVYDPSGGRHLLTLEEIKAEFAIRDEQLRQARRDLITEFEQSHVALYRQADIEKWRGLLDTAVRNAANVLAQRNRSRAEGKSVREPHEWPALGWVNGRESIVIGEPEIAKLQNFCSLY
jgi:hypothetical protein